MRGALDLEVKDCPVCAAVRNKRHKKPTAVLIEEKRQWKPWEKVISDSSGKFRVMSLQGNRSYSVFVCARSRLKLYFAHKKKSHYPMVYLKFLARIGRFPKLLVSDQAGDILSNLKRETFYGTRGKYFSCTSSLTYVTVHETPYTSQGIDYTLETLDEI